MLPTGLSTNFSESELKADIAEVTALRSLCYFYLIRTFRDVPYSTEAFTDDDQKMDLPATNFNIIRQLEKLGNTMFRPGNIRLMGGVAGFFIPSSKLATMRREVLAQIEEQPIDTDENKGRQKQTAYGINDNNAGHKRYLEAEKIDAANVSNHRAEAFYEEHGVKHAAAAFELTDGARSGGSLQG